MNLMERGRDGDGAKGEGEEGVGEGHREIERARGGRRAFECSQGRYGKISKILEKKTFLI